VVSDEHLHELADVLRRKAENKGMGDVLDLENKMVKVVASIGALGMPVDEEMFSECVRVSEAGIAEQTAKLDGLVTSLIPADYMAKNTKNKKVPEERNGLVNWNSHP
jgi:hypothetical protein